MLDLLIVFDSLCPGREDVSPPILQWVTNDCRPVHGSTQQRKLEIHTILTDGDQTVEVGCRRRWQYLDFDDLTAKFGCCSASCAEPRLTGPKPYILSASKFQAAHYSRHINWYV